MRNVETAGEHPVSHRKQRDAGMSRVVNLSVRSAGRRQTRTFMFRRLSNPLSTGCLLQDGGMLTRTGKFLMIPTSTSSLSG